MHLASLVYDWTAAHQHEKLLPLYVLKTFAFLLTFSWHASLAWSLLLSHVVCRGARREIRVRYVTELPLLGKNPSESWIKSMNLCSLVLPRGFFYMGGGLGHHCSWTQGGLVSHCHMSYGFLPALSCLLLRFPCFRKLPHAHQTAVLCIMLALELFTSVNWVYCIQKSSYIYV